VIVKTARNTSVAVTWNASSTSSHKVTGTVKNQCEVFWLTAYKKCAYKSYINILHYSSWEKVANETGDVKCTDMLHNPLATTTEVCDSRPSNTRPPVLYDIQLVRN
jgi:hypothetical protein